MQFSVQQSLSSVQPAPSSAQLSVTQIESVQVAPAQHGSVALQL